MKHFSIITKTVERSVNNDINNTTINLHSNKDVRINTEVVTVRFLGIPVWYSTSHRVFESAEEKYSE